MREGGGAGLHSLAGTAPAFGIRNHLPLLDAIFAHTLPMSQGPTIRQMIDEIRRTGFAVRGMVLLRVGEPSQHILQVVVDHQMMTMRTSTTLEKAPC